MKNWNKSISFSIALSTFLSINSYAFSPEADSGKKNFAICNACHNPSLNPPLAPPMWGVQRRYKRVSQDKKHFIDSVSNFAKSPSQEKSIFKRAVNVLGLMPSVSLSDEDLKNVAAYIWEESFSPPCEHWRYGVAQAEKVGDTAHANKDRKMLKRFCDQ
ncbi:MAG: c-type cytochrome [Spongiibacteraceae bacterium]